MGNPMGRAGPPCVLHLLEAGAENGQDRLRGGATVRAWPGYPSAGRPAGGHRQINAPTHERISGKVRSARKECVTTCASRGERGTSKVTEARCPAEKRGHLGPIQRCCHNLGLHDQRSNYNRQSHPEGTPSERAREMNIDRAESTPT